MRRARANFTSISSDSAGCADTGLAFFPARSLRTVHHRSTLGLARFSLNRLKRSEISPDGRMEMKALVLASAAALALSSAAWAVDADNTAKNQRDADGSTLTVFDQGESAQDRQISASVRELVVKDDSLVH
jgi:hypothetical protein